MGECLVHLLHEIVGELLHVLFKSLQIVLGNSTVFFRFFQRIHRLPPTGADADARFLGDVFAGLHEFAAALFVERRDGQADDLARKIVEKLGMVGLLAVEMFVMKEGGVLVNEIAPRPHNSGHQTIEGNLTSQYEQHLRAILNLPLGDTAIRIPSAMVNLLGEPGHEGPARYQGMGEVLQLSGAYVHLYGKETTRPFRKMGHVTIVDSDVESLKKKANFVKEILKVIS